MLILLLPFTTGDATTTVSSSSSNSLSSFILLFAVFFFFFFLFLSPPVHLTYPNSLLPSCCCANFTSHIATLFWFLFLLSICMPPWFWLSHGCVYIQSSPLLPNFIYICIIVCIFMCRNVCSVCIYKCVDT